MRGKALTATGMGLTQGEGSRLRQAEGSDPTDRALTAVPANPVSKAAYLAVVAGDECPSISWTTRR